MTYKNTYAINVTGESERNIMYVTIWQKQQSSFPGILAIW